MAKIEPIHPYVGEAYIYQGIYTIPENFSCKIEGNKITIMQNKEFEVGDFIHNAYEDIVGNRKIIIGQVKEKLSPLSLVLEGYSQGYTYHPERIVVHTWWSKPAEDYELEMYEDAIENFKREYRDMFNDIFNR